MKDLMKKRYSKEKSCLAVMIVFMIGVLCVSTAGAVPWDETINGGGDAGDLPASAQVVSGSGALGSIIGEIAEDNDVDMYQIFITGGGIFSATTVGGSSIDTRLFLFDENGLGVYANDNYSGTSQSTLPSGPTTSGIYYLAIATYDNTPNAENGFLIFPLMAGSNVVGPSGVGGSSPIGSWTNDGYNSGTYTIALTGAEFVPDAPTSIPEPSTLILLASGLIGFIRFGKR